MVKGVAMRQSDINQVFYRKVLAYKGKNYSAEERARRRAHFIEGQINNTKVVEWEKDEETLKKEAEINKAKFLVSVVLYPIIVGLAGSIIYFAKEVFDGREKLKKSLFNEQLALNGRIYDLEQDRVKVKFDSMGFECSDISDNFECLEAKKRIKIIDRKIEDARFERDLVSRRLEKLS